MIESISNNSLNMESLINEVAANYSKSDLEEKKVTSARVKVNREKIGDQREERIKNLRDQLNGVKSGGGCLKVLGAVFKVIDFIAKPLSAITFGQLKLDLGKTLDNLREAKKQGALLGLKIKGEDILKIMESLKKYVSEDMETLKQQELQSNKETEKVLQILDEIESTFRSTQTV